MPGPECSELCGVQPEDLVSHMTSHAARVLRSAFLQAERSPLAPMSLGLLLMGRFKSPLPIFKISDLSLTVL